ncbi:hypothetical protein PS467_22150 [Streptomyces luomodiensis]|uniref:Secreted protein n=1 Tax=Streptomyces luomodiensis TaxID=3026192 RepID=A0ABY9V543_9ACTN|nr:hypothetical protein [Streptomyces sp. SCA4-21]WNE97840.1 hypothetical protein PS467_22150 [Streptomyces sp. SCA4-21]
MAQSEIPVALIGLGGAVAGAVATVAVGRFTGRASVKAATVAKVDTLQDELTKFCAPFVEARIQLEPALAGRTPTDPWLALAPQMSRAAPRWTSMAADPLALWELPGVVRRKAAYVDGEIRSHQSRNEQVLLNEVHLAARELYHGAKELIDTYTREFRRLAKRGMGVI